MLTPAQIGVSSLLHSIVGSDCHDMSSPTMYSQPEAGGCICSASKATLFLKRQNISPASGPIRQNPSALRIEKELHTPWGNGVKWATLIVQELVLNNPVLWVQFGPVMLKNCTGVCIIWQILCNCSESTLRVLEYPVRVAIFRLILSSNH